nr:hypothetical protein GCM10020092_030520 [Actinoplanes digitatis]
MSAFIPMNETAPADAVAAYQQRFALGMLGGVGVGGSTLAAASLLRVRRGAGAR